MTYEALRDQVTALIDELAPYSFRGRVYYYILETVNGIDDLDFLVTSNSKYCIKTLQRYYRRGLNLRNFVYSTYKLGLSDNKSRL